MHTQVVALKLSNKTGEIMKITKPLCSVIIALIVITITTACSQTPITTKYDKSTDFTKLKTYAWGKNTINIEQTGKTVDRKVEEIGRVVTNRIPDLVNAELKAKGFVLADNENPAFIIQYSAKNRVEKIVTREMYAPGSATAPSNIDQAGTMMIGTLTIYILEPESMKLLWRSQMDTIIKFDGKERNRITRVIRNMFSEFPPPAPKTNEQNS